MVDDPLILRAALAETLRLKALPRAGWLRVGVTHPESVAAHSWGVAWLVLALCPDDLDLGRALAIAVVHDLAEVKAGDITPHDGVPPTEKTRREREGLAALTVDLARSAEIGALWEEYDGGTTPEGRFVKACDKLDMALTAALYAESGADTAEFVASALAALDDPVLRALAAPREGGK